MGLRKSKAVNMHLYNRYVNTIMSFVLPLAGSRDHVQRLQAGPLGGVSGGAQREHQTDRSVNKHFSGVIYKTFNEITLKLDYRSSRRDFVDCS